MRSTTPRGQLVAQALEARAHVGQLLGGQGHGDSEPDDAGDVLGARAQATLVAAAVQDGLQARAALHVQGADPLGAVELVPREAEEIDAELGDVHRQRADGLHGVRVEQGALLVRDPRQRRDRAAPSRRRCWRT